MGCISSIGRIILVVLNLVFVLVSLALIAVGVIFKYFASEILSILGSVDKVAGTLKTDLAIGDLDLKEIANFPFLADVGVALIVFGCVLLVIAFCACCGACCKSRVLLFVFIITMSVLVLSQAVVGGLFLAKSSPLHEKIKSELKDQMRDKYDPRATKDAFSFCINVMNYLLDCCGITGPADFNNSLPVLSCCKRTFVDTSVGKCITPSIYPDRFNTKGCYDKLQDKVLENTLLAGVVLGLLLLIQVILIVFAVLIVKDENSVGPI